MYLVISLLVLRAGYGIWLYQFLIIAYLFTLIFASIRVSISDKQNGILTGLNFLLLLRFFLELRRQLRLQLRLQNNVLPLMRYIRLFDRHCMAFQLLNIILKLKFIRNASTIPLSLMTFYLLSRITERQWAYFVFAESWCEKAIVYVDMHWEYNQTFTTITFSQFFW